MSTSVFRSAERTYTDPEPATPPFYHAEWDSAWVERAIGNIAWRLLRSPLLGHLNRLDLEQELRLHLVRRIRYFLSDQGGHWTYFVIARLREAAASIVNFHRCQVRCPDRRLIQLSALAKSDSKREDSSDYAFEPIDHRPTGKSIHQSQLQHDVPLVLETLPPMEQQLCRCLMRMTVSAAAREMGVPRSTIADAVRRLRGRFEDAGLREFLH